MLFNVGGKKEDAKKSKHKQSAVVTLIKKPFNLIAIPILVIFVIMFFFVVMFFFGALLWGWERIQNYSVNLREEKITKKMQKGLDVAACISSDKNKKNTHLDLDEQNTQPKEKIDNHFIEIDK